MGKNCIIVINDMSGGYKSIREEDLIKAFGEGYETTVFHMTHDRPFKYTEADRIVVCGGDGTFSRMINRYKGKKTEIIYCPCGTLNETSKRDKDGTGDFLISDCGEAANKIFSYVLATGTFTPLGYAVDNGTKQKMKAFAYIVNAFRQLKVWRINAEIDCDGEKREGQYSLLMALDSPQCFGLHFNRIFRPNNKKMHLLLVKAPRFNGFFGLAEMFFSFFRAFFIGFKKPYASKKMLFREFSELKIKTDKEYDFCADGEKWTLPTAFSVRSYDLEPAIRVVTNKGVERLIKEKTENAEKVTIAEI